MKYALVMIQSSRLNKVFMNFNWIMRTENILFPHWKVAESRSSNTTPLHLSSMTILLTNQRTAVSLAPPLGTGSVCWVPQQTGTKKRGQYGAVLLVPSTTFNNRNAKITVLMYNKLNWTELDCLVETRHKCTEGLSQRLEGGHFEQTWQTTV